MYKLKLSFKLIYKLVVVSFLCLISSTEEIAAAESQINIISNKIKAGRLTVSFEAQNFLAGRAIEYLNKGFTLQINYTIELWKSRRFWPDELIAQLKIEHIVTYDIVRQEYSTFRKIGKEISEKTVFKVEQIVDWATRFMDVKISEIDKLHEKPFYYYSIDAELKMLTADDLKDLQLWWRRGVESKREAEDGSHSLSNILLGILYDILVSQKVVKLKIESEKFQISDVVHVEP